MLAPPSPDTCRYMCFNATSSPVASSRARCTCEAKWPEGQYQKRRDPKTPAARMGTLQAALLRAHQLTSENVPCPTSSSIAYLSLPGTSNRSAACIGLVPCTASGARAGAVGGSRLRWDALRCTVVESYGPDYQQPAMTAASIAGRPRAERCQGTARSAVAPNVMKIDVTMTRDKQ